MIFFKSHSCPHHIKNWYILDIVHFKACLILMLMGSMTHIFSFQTSSDGVWQPSFKSQCSSWETACDDFTVGITKQQIVQKQYYSQVAESQTKHRSRLRSWPRLHYVNSIFLLQFDAKDGNLYLNKAESCVDKEGPYGFPQLLHTFVDAVCKLATAPPFQSLLIYHLLSYFSKTYILKNWASYKKLIKMDTDVVAPDHEVLT